MYLHYYHRVQITNHSTTRTSARCLGLGLIQVMISLLLSVLILSGTIQWYQLLKKILINTRAKAENLEIGRIVLQYLSNDLKTAGYLGCRSMDPTFPIRENIVDSKSQPYFRRDRKVFGLHVNLGDCQTKLPSTICTRLKEDSDVLIIYNIPGKILLLKESMKRENAPIEVNQEKAMAKGALALISDCQHGDIFIANSVEKTKIFHQKGPTTNLREGFSKNYQAGAEVVELQTVAYYLGIPERQKQTPHSYSLFRDNLWFNAEEIIEGIVDFQVEYGIWNDFAGIIYKPAAIIQSTQWKDVNHIRLKLKTKNNHLWEYHFAIRNWQYLDSRFNYVDSFFNVVAPLHPTKHIH